MSERVFLEPSFSLHLYWLKPSLCHGSRTVLVTWFSSLFRVGICFTLFLADRYPVFAGRLSAVGFQWLDLAQLQLLGRSFLFWARICLPIRCAHGLELQWLSLLTALRVFEDSYRVSTTSSFRNEHPISFPGSHAVFGCPPSFSLPLVMAL